VKQLVASLAHKACRRLTETNIATLYGDCAELLDTG
jgi:hypothetical protein